MFEDIKLVIGKILGLPILLFGWIKFIWPIIKWSVLQIKKFLRYINIFKIFKKKDNPIVLVDIDTENIKVEKTGIIKRINYIITPKAKITYWQGDEQITAYISNFSQKDKFKLIYKDLNTGRMVMVNSAEAINYRLEELTPEDPILPTQIQQNQKY